MRPIARRGVTMMEVAIGTLLVGGVLAATLNLVGPTVRVTANAGDNLLAVVLADDLLDEVVARPFVDPTKKTGPIGFEPGESFSSRKDFDDVDDFDDWSSSLVNDNGDPMDAGAGWRQTVAVEHVQASDPTVVSNDATGVKRVTVRVYRHDVLLAERSILRTQSFSVTVVP